MVDRFFDWLLGLPTAVGFAIIVLIVATIAGTGIWIMLIAELVS